MPHAVPQVPQFWLSVWLLTHEPLQASCPALHIGPPLLGCAQPETTRARATQAKADKNKLRAFMTETPYVRASS